MEIYPFTKIAWRSEKIRQIWEPVMARIGDASWFAEYESVKRGLRPCDVYQLDPDKFDWQIKRVTLDSLWFMPILRSKQYKGFGHRHYEKDTIDRDTFIYGVVGKKREDAIKFHDAGVTDLRKRVMQWSPLEMNPNGIDHDVTGELLGYPKCDRNFFVNTWLKGGCLDPEYEIASNTENAEFESTPDTDIVKVSGNPLLNRLTRYWGFQIIPYFSHSFDCQESVKFAQWWIKLMREKDSEATNLCLKLLDMPMEWSVWNGIIYIDHPLFVGAANGYYPTRKKVVKWFPSSST